MKNAIAILICFLWMGVNAQEQRPICGNEILTDLMEEKHPGYREAEQESFDHVKMRMQIAQSMVFKTAATSNEAEFDTIFRIPVVVHVLHNEAEENISDSLVIEQIRVLNESFNRTGPDTANTRAIFLDRVRPANIEFYLATEDPDGNPSTGIVRKQTTMTTFGSLSSLEMLDRIKSDDEGGSSPWNTNKYLNIWCGNISIPNFGDLLLGYAYPPVNGPNWPASYYMDSAVQGVVVHYKVFGPNNPLASGPIAMANAGKTAVHEVGHYLGLRHIWGDPSGNRNGCAVDDGIDDTPLCRAPDNYRCNLGANTCQSLEPLPDMIENYMDYSGDACQNAFTYGQIMMMRFNLKQNRAGVVEKEYVAPEIDPTLEDDLYVSVSTDFEYAFHLTKAGDFTAKVYVFDIAGQMVFEATTEGRNNSRIDFPALFFSSGIYFVRTEGDLNKTAKFTIMR